MRGRTRQWGPKVCAGGSRQGPPGTVSSSLRERHQAHMPKPVRIEGKPCTEAGKKLTSEQRGLNKRESIKLAGAALFPAARAKALSMKASAATLGSSPGTEFGLVPRRLHLTPATVGPHAASYSIFPSVPSTRSKGRGGRYKGRCLPLGTSHGGPRFFPSDVRSPRAMQPHRHFPCSFYKKSSKRFTYMKPPALRRVRNYHLCIMRVDAAGLRG